MFILHLTPDSDCKWFDDCGSRSGGVGFLSLDLASHGHRRLQAPPLPRKNKHWVEPQPESSDHTTVFLSIKRSVRFKGVYSLL